MHCTALSLYIYIYINWLTCEHKFLKFLSDYEESFNDWIDEVCEDDRKV